MTNTKTLQELIEQALALLEEIRQHPEFKALEYSPDVMIGDAILAVQELDWALQEPRYPRIFIE
ncbi:hypothetical protein [Nostoc sp.]|uniref:hypothetical protein n=1 Tax=Nostoc sp. TaxID=1180 RepID=UPI002FFC5E4B